MPVFPKLWGRNLIIDGLWKLIRWWLQRKMCGAPWEVKNEMHSRVDNCTPDLFEGQAARNKHGTRRVPNWWRQAPKTVEKEVPLPPCSPWHAWQLPVPTQCFLHCHRHASLDICNSAGPAQVRCVSPVLRLHCTHSFINQLCSWKEKWKRFPLLNSW